jgi:hypothetical protein
MSNDFTFKGLNELKSFILELKSQGIDAENVLKSLRFIYVANSIPYMRDVTKRYFISPIKEEMLDILENYFKEGWQFISILPPQRILIRKPKFLCDKSD